MSPETTRWSAVGGVFMSRILGAGLAFVSTLMISRLFGADDAGTYFLGLAIVSIAVTVSRIGTEMPVLRAVAVAVEKGDWGTARSAVAHAWRTVAVVGGALALAVLLLAGRFEAWFAVDDLGTMLRLLAIGIVPAGVLVITAHALIGAGRAVVGEAVLRAGVNVAFIFSVLVVFGFIGATAMAVGWTTAQLAMMALGVFIWLRWSGATSSGGTVSARLLLRAGVPLLFAASIDLVVVWLDTLMIGSLLDSADVGVYVAAARTASVVSFVLIAVGAVAGPRFAVLYEAGRRSELRALLRRTTLLSGGGALVLTVPIVLLSGFLMGLFGSEFQSGADVLVILAVGQFINSATGLVGLMLIMSHNESKLLQAAAIAAVVNAGLNLWLIPRYGLTGAAWASLIAVATLNITRWFFVRGALRDRSVAGPGSSEVDPPDDYRGDNTTRTV